MIIKSDLESGALWEGHWPVPNLSLQQSIVFGPVGLLKADEDALQFEPAEREPLRTLLAKFKDEFGVSLRPAFMATQKVAVGRVRSLEAVTAFRDAVCISVLPTSHAKFAVFKQSYQGVNYSDAFDFYPWHIAQSHGSMGYRIVANTPAMMGIHALSHLQPQCSPAIGHGTLGHSDVDWPLCNAIMERWTAHFEQAGDAAADRRLFRALQMARAAARMPAGPDAHYYDVGRSLALWVSAFEILAHDGRSSASKVIALLERAPWLRDGLKACDQSVRIGTSHIKSTVAGAFYAVLNKVRNDFLHGNEVTDRTLLLPGSERRILDFAAPVFRMAVAAQLDVSFKAPYPTGETVDVQAEWINARMDFQRPQRLIERALLASREPDDADEVRAI